jgi:hypothetical protein
MLKKTNAILIGKKSGSNFIGKKGGSIKSVIEKSFNNQYNQKSPLER